MKKIFSVLNAIFIGIALILAYNYYLHGGLALKAITSGGFVAVGIINLIYAFAARAKNKLFSVLMACGLVFSFMGDVILNVEFMTGAIIFAIGHIFYFTAYCRLNKFNTKDLIPIIVIFIAAALLLLIYPKFNFGIELMKYVCIFYALVISFMLGKAISNLIGKRNFCNALTVVGSVLFFISDLALVFYVFAGADKLMDTLCLVTYFPAQCILAFSMFVNACREN